MVELLEAIHDAAVGDDSFFRIGTYHLSIVARDQSGLASFALTTHRMAFATKGCALWYIIKRCFAVVPRQAPSLKLALYIWSSPGLQIPWSGALIIHVESSRCFRLLPIGMKAMSANKLSLMTLSSYLGRRVTISLSTPKCYQCSLPAEISCKWTKHEKHLARSVTQPMSDVTDQTLASSGMWGTSVYSDVQYCMH